MPGHFRQAKESHGGPKPENQANLKTDETTAPMSFSLVRGKGSKWCDFGSPIGGGWGATRNEDPRRGNECILPVACTGTRFPGT